MADLGGYEGVRQASLPGLPDLPGRPIRRSGGGLCPPVLHRFAAQNQTETFRHILPRWSAAVSTPPPAAAPPSARRRGRPPAASTSAPARPQQQPSQRPQRGAARRKAAQPASAPAKRVKCQDPALQEMVTAPLLPPEEGWVENLLFPFCSVPPLAPEDAMPSPAPPAQPWSQVSVAPHTQTPLRDALPFELGPCAPLRCPTAGKSVTPLVPLVRSLGAWLELPRPSRWLLRTIRLGYAIQFARHPHKFRGIRFTSV